MSKDECLCGRISWEIVGEIKASYHCHCKQCRKIHGAAFGTYCLTPAENFK